MIVGEGWYSCVCMGGLTDFKVVILKSKNTVRTKRRSIVVYFTFIRSSPLL